MPEKEKLVQITIKLPVSLANRLKALANWQITQTQICRIAIEKEVTLREATKE